MQGNSRKSKAKGPKSLQAIWAPWAPLHQPVELELGAMRLSRNSITVLKRQSTNIVSLYLHVDLEVPRRIKQEFLETLLMFAKCRRVEFGNTTALQLKYLYRLCYRSPIRKSLVSLHLGELTLDGLVVGRLTKAVAQGDALKEFRLSSVSTMKIDLSPLILTERKL